MVEVEFERLHRIEQLRQQEVEIGVLLRREAESEGHETFVFGEEDGLVFRAGRFDDGFRALDQFRSERLTDALGGEDLVVHFVARADEFAEAFAEADEVPPDDAGLVAVRVAEHVVVVIGRVVGVEVVEEGEGAEVEGEAEEGGVVGVEDAVGEGVGLPFGDC